ncbi:hypothetical protein NQ117_09980 [Paenibacillus sp. SC116]|nr:hypothetical protein [Paenibacillus sp. SC116]
MLLSLGAASAFAAPAAPVQATKVDNVIQQVGSLYMYWTAKPGTHYYRLVLRNLNDNHLYINNDILPSTQTGYSSVGLPYGPYRVWIGAYTSTGQFLGGEEKIITLNGHQSVALNP